MTKAWNEYMREYSMRPEVREKRLARSRSVPFEVKRAYHLKRFYGITLEQYNELLEKQGGVCAGCGSEGSQGKRKGLFVDHDHETGRIRGLLCNNCNAALGLLDDSLETLRRIAAYVESSKSAKAA